MMIRAFPFVALIMLPPLAGQTVQQGQKPPEKQQTAGEELQKLLAEDGISIDKEKGLVRAEGKVTITNDFLEYVAIGPSGKKHEALVTLRCKGSTLNAALIALGLEKGRNVDFEPIDPLPSEEEVLKGAPTTKVIPPEGPRLHLTLTWHDAEQVLHTVAIEDLILDIRAENTIQNAEWIYFGGMMAPLLRGEPPVFIADYEQNYISTYYAKPDSHLITMKHERARFDENWWPYAKRLPPRGTDCTLVFSLKPICKRLPPIPKEGKEEPKEGEKSGEKKKGD